MRNVVCILLLVSAAGASAQLGVPKLPLPGTPSVPLPVDVPGTVANVRGDAKRLLELRDLRRTRLIRQHRDALERAPDGAPIVRAELLGVGPTDEAVARAREAGYKIRRDERLDGVGLRLVVYLAPSSLSTDRALRKLRKLDPDGLYDFNHIYETTGEVVTPDASGLTATEEWTGRIGLVDGGVDTETPAIRDVVIEQSGCGTPMPSAHGTGVAALLVRAAPGAQLLVVDVYCGEATGGGVERLIDAFATLARANVPVVNVSLVGPTNRVLEATVASVLDRGIAVVAAVGNDGPAAPPLYPAAYSGVIGVTAVDARRKVLIEACRGPHVDFSALGATLEGRGTSFAAPLVAGLLARSLLTPDTAARDAAVVALTARAIDLGKKGRDDVYGAGLVGN